MSLLGAWHIKCRAEPSRADSGAGIEAIVSAYLAEAGGDPWVALRHVVSDALTDLLEMERRSRRAERLISRGYVRRSLGHAENSKFSPAKVGK
jgi:hypothetical protein